MSWKCCCSHLVSVCRFSRLEWLYITSPYLEVSACAWSQPKPAFYTTAIKGNHSGCFFCTLTIHHTAHRVQCFNLLMPQFQWRWLTLRLGHWLIRQYKVMCNVCAFTKLILLVIYQRDYDENSFRSKDTHVFSPEAFFSLCGRYALPLRARWKWSNAHIKDYRALPHFSFLSLPFLSAHCYKVVKSADCTLNTPNRTWMLQDTKLNSLHCLAKKRSRITQKTHLVGTHLLKMWVCARTFGMIGSDSK